MKYIQKIGLEIEGAWYSVEQKPIPAIFQHDGSVRNIRPTRNGIPLAYIGEAASNPLESMEAVRQWIEYYWPDRKNKTCGFHIHVSMEPKQYRRLMQRAFYDKFLASAEEFSRNMRLSKNFAERLSGTNRYCLREFRADQQARASHKNNSRYAHLNYCYSLHGTLENRLPCATMPKKKAYATVEWFVNVIEEFLDTDTTKFELPALDISYTFVEENA